MRGFVALILSVGLLSTIAAHAAPNLSPISCAWDKLPAAEQTRLRDGFKVDLKDETFALLFADANAAASAEAAQACQLNASPAQIEHLALGLSRHAGEEKAKKGLAEHGATMEAVMLVLEKMHQGKREVIGDSLACPGSHAMVVEWDQSLKSAVRRAKLRFEEPRAYSFVSLTAYTVMAQEGAMRRMEGKADAC